MVSQTSSNNSPIYIGIVDYKQQQYANSSYMSKNAVCYYGYDGHKYPVVPYTLGNKQSAEGGGFRQGQEV